MRRTSFHNILKNVIATVLTAAMATAMLPAVAFGQVSALSQSASVDCGNGWTLNCTVEDGAATIVSYTYSETGTSDLSIPATVSCDGVDVPIVGVAEKAFMNCTNLGKVTFSDNLAYVEQYAFYKTSATSISLGAGFTYVEDYGFAYNASLESVTFAKGNHPEYFSVCAFSCDTALIQLEIPGLRGRDHVTSWTPNRIGAGCFNGCSSLEKIIYDPDTDDPTSYYKLGNNNSPIYNGCSKLVVVSGRSFTYQNTNITDTAAATYFTAYFYPSQQAAEADTYRNQCTCYAIMVSGITLTNISCGTVDAENFYDATGDTSAFTTGATTSLPALADFGFSSDDYAWGFTDGSFTSSSSSLSGSVCLFPASKKDISFSYVTSSEIRNYSANSGMRVNTSSRGNECYFRLRDDGTVDLSNLEVRSVDGSVLDPSTYQFYYRKATSTGGYTYKYDEFTDPAEINAAGTYSVCALGVGDYQGTYNEWVNIYVKRYDGTVKNCTTGTANEGASYCSYNSASSLKANRLAVVAPSNCWQADLVATGLAGAAQGLAVFTDGANTATKAFQAINSAKVDYLVFLGSKSDITQSVISQAQLLYYHGVDEGASSFIDASASTYTGTDDSYASALACYTYETYKKTGPRLDDPFEWGTTAVVVSGTAGNNALSIAQYAYQSGSPVFFTNDSGQLSTRTKTCLADFENVVVVGSESEVSADVLNQAASCVNAQTATRVMTQGSSYANSVELAGLLKSGDDALPSAGAASSIATISIADAVNPSCTVAGAIYAALNGGITLSCRDSLDLKRTAQYLIDANEDNVKTVAAVGPLQSTGLTAIERINNIWSVNNKATTAPEVGDTFAFGGLEYRLGASGKVSVAGVSDALTQSVTIPASVTYEGTTYTVTSLEATAFAGNATLKQVAFAAGCAISSIPAGAFANCTSLASFVVPAKIASIGSKAFYNCKALRTVTFAAGSALAALQANTFYGCTTLGAITVPAKVKTIAASCFQGCKALASVKLSSALTSIGSKAFYGCAVKSIAIPSKTTTIGTFAFANCTKLTSFASGAKLKTVGASTFSGCKALKTLKVASASLSKKGVKKALSGSSIKTVKLSSKAAKKKLKKYKKFFTKANCGKKVIVKK